LLDFSIVKQYNLDNWKMVNLNRGVAGVLSFSFFLVLPPKGNMLRSSCALKANGKK
jgi:hypothetical protein